MLSSGSGSRRLAVGCGRGSIRQRAVGRWLESTAPVREGKSAVRNAWPSVSDELWQFDVEIETIIPRYLYHPMACSQHAFNATTIDRHLLVVRCNIKMTKL